MGQSCIVHLKRKPRNPPQCIAVSKDFLNHLFRAAHHQRTKRPGLTVKMLTSHRWPATLLTNAGKRLSIPRIIRVPCRLRIQSNITQRMQSNKITSNIQVNLSNKLKHSRKSIVHRKKQVSAISKIQSIICGKLIRKQTIVVRSIQSIVALQLQEALNQNRRLYGTTIRSTSELFKSIDRTNDGIIIKDEIYI